MREQDTTRAGVANAPKTVIETAATLVLSHVTRNTKKEKSKSKIMWRHKMHVWTTPKKVLRHVSNVRDALLTQLIAREIAKFLLEPDCARLKKETVVLKRMSRECSTRRDATDAIRSRHSQRTSAT